MLHMGVPHVGTARSDTEVAKTVQSTSIQRRLIQVDNPFAESLLEKLSSSLFQQHFQISSFVVADLYIFS